MAPLLFCIIGIIYFIAIIRYGFIDIVPVARSRIFESQSSPIFVLNPYGKIIDLNQAAEELIKVTKGTLIGKNICDPEFSWDDFCSEYDSKTNAPFYITKQVDGETRVFLAKIDDIISSSKRNDGRIIQFEDITERTRYEKIILDNESRFRQLADAAFEGIFIHQKGIIKDVNQGICDLLLYPREEMIGRSLLSFVEPGHIDLVQRKMGEDSDTHYEAVFIGKDSRTIRGEIRAKNFVSGDERLRIGTIWDISERYQREKYNHHISLLKQHLLGEKALHDKLTCITDLLVEIFKADFARIWVIAPGDCNEHRCIHVKDNIIPDPCKKNPSCLHLIVSSGRYSHVDGIHARIPFGSFKTGRIASGEEDYVVTNDVIHDERIHDHEWAASLGLQSFSGFKLVASDGRPIGVLALFSKTLISDTIIAYLKDIADITSMVIQKGIADTFIEESEKKFISIFQNSQDAIAILTPEFIIMDVNQKFNDIFGYPGESLQKKHFSDLSIFLHASDLNMIMEKCHTDNIDIKNEYSFLTRDGVPFVGELNISRVTIHNTPSHMVQIHNIDEIRKAYNAVAQVNNKLKILSSITRHDILNRIMIASGYNDLMGDVVTDPELITHLTNIKEAISEIQGLISFTGEYEELGESAPEWQRLDDIFRKSVIQNLLKGIDFQSDTHGVEIYADRMLVKVIYNLVENSIRHGEDMTSIRCNIQHKDSDLIIVYTDNGGGIIDNDKDHIFKRGFGKNTGLGMFLSREILSITGITISECGVPGVGVRFEIRVPSGIYRELSG